MTQQNELTNLETIEISTKYRHGDCFDLTGYTEEIITKTRQATLREVMEWLRQYAIHGSQITLEWVLDDLEIHSPYGNHSVKRGYMC